MNALLGQLSSRIFTADQVLSPYVYVFYASFIVSFLFTPVMRGVAMYYRIVDSPDRARKMHQVPVAYLGGVAVFLGWLAGLAVSLFLALHRQEAGWPIAHPSVHFSVIIGALIIVVLGLWDDILGLKPAGKILGQVTAAVFLLLGEVGTECTRPFLEAAIVKGYFVFTGGTPPDLSLTGWFMPLIYVSSGALVVTIVVLCCNATNLMDGLDGLCGGVTAVIAFGFLFVAVHLAMYGGGLNTNWDAVRVILGLALLGAVLGFVPFNFNPASIFMGDTGSMFLGYVCAVMIVLMAQEKPKWFLASMVMFALPILDTSLAFARRWIAGRPLFMADAQHFHHQLVQRGFTVKQTVLISYGLAIFFGVLGASIVFMRTRYAVALYLVTFGSIIVAAYKMGMIHERPNGGRPKSLKDGDGANSEMVNAGSAFEVVPLGRPTLQSAGDLAIGRGSQTPESGAAKPVSAMPPAA